MKTNKLMVSVKLNKPTNLNFDELINPEFPYFTGIRKDNGGTNFKPTTGKYLRKQIPALYYFIHVLLERLYTKTNVQRFRYDEKYVRMYSRDIEPFKSKNDFKYIWKLLYQLKVVEYKNVNEPTQYRQSANVYYFTLREEYLNSIIVQHQVLVRNVIADKLNSIWKTPNIKANRNLGNNSIQWKSAHQHQQIKNLRFDEESARTYSNKLISDKIIEVGRYNACQISINNIANGRIGYSESKVCNRIYTNVTGMPKELRQFIMDSEGKSMIEIDFSSFNAYAVYKIINTLIPDFKSDIEKMAFESEINIYRNLLLSDDFYISFHQFFFRDEQLSRKQVKDKVLKQWFNAKLTNKSRFRKTMQIKLPQISEIIDFLKVDNYKYFSHTTMKLESELVNDIIYKKFIEIHPDAKLYSIFDSFLVEQKYSNELKSMMEQEGSKYFNISCKVKAKKTVVPTDVIEPDDELIKQPSLIENVDLPELVISDSTNSDSNIKPDKDINEEIALPTDVSSIHIGTKPIWSEDEIREVFKSIFPRTLNRFDEIQVKELFTEFTKHFNNLSNDEKELLMTPYDNIGEDKFFKKCDLENKLRNLCEGTIQLIFDNREMTA